MPEKEYKLAVIEDDVFLYKALTEGLKRRGFLVCGSSDSEEAIELIKKEKPDLVLLDLIMPNLSGEEVLVQKDEIEEIKNIPVIILTNKGDNKSMENCFSYKSVKEYLIKANYTITEISEFINKVLNK